MLSLGRSSDMTVRRLRARVDPTGFDPLATRFHLERLLGALELTLPWVSPAAILCIRHLPDPLPQALPLGRGDFRPPPAWERALLALVEQKMRSAVRPALGSAPADAEAVVFADRAELLACLALDVCTGESVRWWWQALFKHECSLRQVLAELFEAPEHLPPVLEHLARRGYAAPLVGQWSRAEGTAALERVVERFGLTHLAEALRASKQPTAAAPTEGDDVRTPIVEAPETAAPLTPAPWRHYTGDSELGTLTREHELLLGVALMLQRRPTTARSAEFAEAVATYRLANESLEARRDVAEHRTAAMTPIDDGPPDAHASPPASPHATPHEQNDGHTVQPGSTNVSTFPETARVSPPAGVTAHSPTLSASLSAVASRTEAAHSEPGRAPLPLAPGVPALDPVGALAPPVVSSPLAAPPASPNAMLERVYGAATATELGGLFYLVNVALALGLYPDFTRPADAGIALPLWDFVALLGEALLGAREPDPAWTLLARLAGREPTTPPGHALSAPEETMLPADWLALLPNSPPRPPAALGMRAWVDGLAPFVRARLAQALAVEEATPVADWVLRRSARVHVSDSHVDVVFSLAELPVAVRAAGLDRDPGWLPAAGRFLAFHFR
ncbi:MAG TPA: hypothetical protein VGQ57_00075 [Polyangiaceae bacterium]|jgi:hypothetical protein|nr:hypothetical protein [Polyangiaceae bacterium]